jgi:hypothetical protein
MIDGKQRAIVWHVDDLKMSHVDSEVNTAMIGLIDSEFGKESPITVTRGKAHDHLGMTLDCNTKGKAKIKMLDGVAKMIEELPEEFDGEATTPAGCDLFKNDENLCNAKTSFTCKHARRGPICRQQSHFCTKG